MTDVATPKAKRKANRRLAEARGSAAERGEVEAWLVEKYGKPLELFWSIDHIDGPRWVARYPSGMSYDTWGAKMTCNFKECVIENGKVVEA